MIEFEKIDFDIVQGSASSRSCKSCNELHINNYYKVNHIMRYTGWYRLYDETIQKYCSFKIELSPYQKQLLSDFHYKKTGTGQFLSKNQDVANAILFGLELHNDIFKALDTATNILKNKERFGNIQTAIDIVKAIEQENINVEVR